jgi:hypothetical protein
MGAAVSKYPLTEELWLTFLGFLSDNTFIGGRIGFVAGNQQYTFRNLKFRGCRTAIQVIWNWGMTASQLDIQGSTYGIDASEFDSSKVNKEGNPRVPQGAAVSSYSWLLYVLLIYPVFGHS